MIINEIFINNFVDNYNVYKSFDSKHNYSFLTLREIKKEKREDKIMGLIPLLIIFWQWETFYHFFFNSLTDNKLRNVW